MLTLENVTLGYEQKPVIQLNRLSLEKGSQCLVTGPSGSGKTTLLYAIAGLLPALSGSITIAGRDITRLSESGRDRFRARHIGIVFQTLHLVRALSVMDNLMLGFYAAGLRQDRAYAQSMLEKLGIAQKRNAMPDTLSQGQAQRVAIARALACRPALLLADEPTSSLDDASCANVITLLKHAAEESGATLLVSTHDARVKAYFSTAVQLERAE